MDHQFRSDLRTIGDVDEEYQKTVEQISRLEDRLQELRTYRDHLAPISRLPVEALTEIFSLLHEQSLFDYQRRPCGHVLTATVSICRHWRQIVISTPSFWTHIGTISVPWLECSLERLKDSPLVIDLSLARSDQRHKDDSRSISKMLDILQRSLPTIRSFTFWASKNSTRRLNRFDLPGNASWGPAVLLETLSLGKVSLSNSFLSGGLPVLRNLSLRLCSFDWDKIPPLPHLKELFIVDPTQKTTDMALLRYLKTVPLLESLKLWRVLSDTRVLNHHNDERVLLSSLRHLHVEGFFNFEVHNLFGGITIPSDTSILIEGTLDGDEAENVRMRELFSTIAGCRMVPLWNPVELTASMGDAFSSIKIYEDIRTAAPIFHSRSGAFTIRSDTFKHFCTLLNLTNLTTLDLSLSPTVDLDHFTIRFQTFSQLSHLRILKARKEAAPSLVGYLFHEAEAISTDNRAQLERLPLSFLALEILALDASCSGYDPDHLILALETRIKHRHHIQRLIIYADDREGENILRKFAHLADSVERLAHPDF